MFAAHNTIVALVLALFVYGLTRLWRNPPVAHVLWLLVLLKLVAPPVMRVDWPALRLPESTHTRGPDVADGSRIEGSRGGKPGARFRRSVDGERNRRGVERRDVNEHDLAARFRLLWDRGRPVLFWFWLGGAALCALVAATRIRAFRAPACETRCRRPNGCNGSHRKSPASSASDGCPTCAMSSASRLPCSGAPAVAPTIVLPMRLLPRAR